MEYSVYKALFAGGLLGLLMGELSTRATWAVFDFPTRFESNKKTAVAIGALEGSISGAALGALSGNTMVPGPGLFFGLAGGAAIGMGAGALRTKNLYKDQFIKKDK